MKEKKRIELKYLRNGKNVSTATEGLKQRLVATSSRLERYEARCKQYRQNRMFHINQKRFYDEISDTAPKTQPIPDSTESNEFWSALLDKPINHKTDASCLKDMRKEQATQQDNFQVQLRTMRQHLKECRTGRRPGQTKCSHSGSRISKACTKDLHITCKCVWSQDNFHNG